MSSYTVQYLKEHDQLQPCLVRQGYVPGFTSHEYH